MFTRKNKAVALMIYLIFFLLILTLFGENGVFSRRELEEKQRILYAEREKKIAELELLREESTTKSTSSEEGELLYSFESPASEGDNHSSYPVFTQSYTGLKTIMVAFVSLLPAFLYLIIVFLFNWRRKR